jgi:hypothetical protein
LAKIAKFDNMKTYLSDLIPRLQRFSKELDDKTLFIGKHWILIDDEADTRTVYIFRPNSELLIATNGNVHKAAWEYLGQSSILIKDSDGTQLFRHGFLDDRILALCLDGTRSYAFMVNEKHYDDNINSSKKINDFLQNSYLPFVPTHDTASTAAGEITTPGNSDGSHTVAVVTLAIITLVIIIFITAFFSTN